ncbi:MAG: type I-C CRISPR-associated protein Cas5 [Oscillospiraceae bacterium]|nr:type I-C CRISPR-associated protein Cas5 [Oscillospiraceae bacterium]
MPVLMEVWGDYGCFSRPELKVERVSYEVMTPSAARGILDAIFWHPGMRWQIDRIYVLAPIQFTNIRRNECKSKVSGSKVRTVMGSGKGELCLYTSEDIQQRAAMVLRDVHYVIEAHFEMTGNATPSDNPGKFQDMITRRLDKGQCFHQPCFGTREFPAKFCRWTGKTIPTIHEDRELGLMLFDIDYSDSSDIRPMFFRANLKNGIMEVPAPASREVFR